MLRFFFWASALAALGCAPGEFQSNAGAGALPGGGSGEGSGGGGGGGDSGGDAPTVEMAPAPGLTIEQIAIYQGVKRTLVGSPTGGVPVPIVAGRDALVRVFALREASFSGRPVTAQLSIDDSDPIFVQVQQVAESATDANLSSTINFEVPGELITAGSQFRVDLMQPAAEVSAENPAATFPPGGGMEPLGAETVQKPLTIVLVPVTVGGRQPDTSPAQLDLFRRGFSDQYPAADVDITVRAQPYTFAGQLSANGGGWSTLLNDIADLRQEDNVASHTYYYGIFRPTETLAQFCGGGCVAGLGFVAPAGDPTGRAAIGLGYAGFDSVETGIHEVGHNHGRDHSPCGTAGDPAFPHPGGRIGAWGYSLSQGALIDPNVGRDFMGYCDNNWVSDHTYSALFQRMKQIDAQALVAAAQPTAWRRALIHPDGHSEELAPMVLGRPGGSARTIRGIDARGAQVELEGYLLEFDHLDGGVLFYPEDTGRLRALRLVDGPGLDVRR